MIFIGTLKGFASAILILLCLFLLLKIFVKNFRINDTTKALLLISFGVSVVLMSIFYCLSHAEYRVKKVRNRITSSISQVQNSSNGRLNRESLMDYIEDNLPNFVSKQQSQSLSEVEIDQEVNKYADSALRKLRVAKYIVLSLELLIQFLISLWISNECKKRIGGYGRSQRSSYLRERDDY